MLMRTIKSFLLMMVLFSALSSPVFADPIIVSPTSNIVNNLITKRTSIVVLQYGYDIVLDSESSITLFESGVPVSISYEIVGTTLRISKTTNYLPLKTYRLEARNIKTSTPDVTFSDFVLSFKYSSYKEFVIGQTVRGRNIYGYSLGEGTQVYLLVGAMHGNEKNTVELVDWLLRKFIDKPYLIPDDSKLVFVPVLNKDGYMGYNRFNAHGVDLNRNSGTDDWQSLTYWGYTQFPNGGGESPDSEPELIALQRLIPKYKPYFVISYHSSGGCLITNGKAARDIVWSYYTQSKSKYRYIDQSSGSEAYTYKVTGDFTVWLRERNRRAMTVELQSKTEPEIKVNLRALLYVINRY